MFTGLIESTGQLAELKIERSLADNDPGMWSQPRGDDRPGS